MSATVTALSWGCDPSATNDLAVQNYTFGVQSDRVRSVGNEIFFTDAVSPASIEALIKEFHAVISRSQTASSGILGKNDASVAITLYIDSPGGYLKDCFKFIDYVSILQASGRVSLTTVITGIAASAATLMAIVGDKRYIMRNALCMVHELFSGSMGTFTQLSSGMKMLQNQHEKLLAIYLQHNKRIERQSLETLLQKETWFTAAEYVENGFVDGLYMMEGR